MKYLYSDW